MNKFELLEQATCAVVQVDPLSGAEESVGTAWLAMAPRYLLTAGHVVKGMASDTVRVRFLGEESEPAVVKFGPFQDDDLGVDVAVLELQRETPRQPLPMLLVNQPQGDVLVVGYGLPNAQSKGLGTYLREYVRNHQPGSFLLQYTSRELTLKGFSGGPVYSLASDAVVALQTEAAPQAEQVLAMPLSRIPRYWEALTSVARRPSRGLCVVLVPPSRDDRLVEDVIGPALDSLNLEMYLSSVGATTSRDLAKLDRADVVIADASSDDSFVTRELTVAQGLGTPDVVIRSAGSPMSGVHTNVLELDPADPAGARRMLVERLVTTLAVFDAVGELTAANPITSFFGAPLTRVSAANALALGYFKNFVEPVGRLLQRACAGQPVTIVVDGAAVDVDGDDGLRVILQVVLPEHLDWASDKGIRQRLDQHGVLVPAQVGSPFLSRPRSLKALRERAPDGSLVLVDAFPTTMATMVDSINERFAGQDPADRDPELWAAIERKEIDRFGRSLARRIRDDDQDVDDVTLQSVALVTTSRQAFPALDLQ